MWSLVKKIFEGKLSIKEARKQQNAIEKKIKDLGDRLNYSSPGKGMKPLRKKKIRRFTFWCKNFYIIRESIINNMFNTADEKLDIATGDYDKIKSVIEAISRLGDKEEPEIGKGLKIMTPKQTITRLPILLAQKQAGNNSQKLNNEIRKIIYSLYRSKNLSKTVYNHLINSI